MKGYSGFLKIASMLVIALFLFAGTGAAYLDNYTVLDTFPDGQAKRGMIPDFFIYEDGRALIRDYSEFNADRPFAGRWAPMSDGDTGLYIEWNSYGQVLKINGQPERVLEMFYDVERIDRQPADIVIYQENGEVVAYKDKLINRYEISSIKTPHEYPPYQSAGLNAKEYMEKFGVDKNYILNSSNYQTISDNLYKRTPEYQAEENARILQELEEAKNKLNTTSQTVEKHEKRFGFIWQFIYDTFGVSLW